MKILILTNYPFPYGMAQTNRLIAMAKGLVEAGAQVEVMVSKATELQQVRNTEAKGEYEGVKFSYATRTTIRPKGKIARIRLYFIGMRNMLRIIKQEHQKGKIDAVFLGVFGNRFSLKVYRITQKLGIKLIQERSEYPFLSYSNSFWGQRQLKTYLTKVCSKFDGFIVISKALDKYFTPYLKPEAEKYTLPILVETERFDAQPAAPKNVISYCGSMQGIKDGVPILIDAFHKIASKFPEVKLQLIGSTNFPEFETLKDSIKTLGLEDRVIFTGRAERNEMPKLLSESKMVALARPTSKQAEGGFPTKLGEYLATGRLTIVTKVGDIPDFLTHQENALLAEPDSAEDFAQKLEQGLLNEKMRERIGAKGKQLAHDVFNYKVQGEKLYNWVQKLIDS